MMMFNMKPSKHITINMLRLMILTDSPSSQVRSTVAVQHELGDHGCSGSLKKLTAATMRENLTSSEG